MRIHDRSRKIRNRRYVREGLCINHPNTKAVFGRIHCQLCLNGMKKRYEKAVQGRMCTHHPHTKAEKGKQLCSACRIYGRISRLKNLGLSKEECRKARIALETFDGVCQSCKVEIPRGEQHTDHDDKKKKFRGIICYGCNLSIGNTQESPARLRAAANYLEKHQLTESA